MNAVAFADDGDDDRYLNFARELEIPDPWQNVLNSFDPPKSSENLFKSWVPFPKQLEATNLAQLTDELLFGGAAGPGKSEWLMEYLIREMENNAGNRGIIFRRVLPSLKRSIMPRLKAKLLPIGRARWSGEDKTFTFPNTSILELGSVQYADDVLNYQGAEYGCMGFEEVTEFIPSQYEYLLGRLRTPATALNPIRAHAVSTANPGGAYHSYYKGRFVKPPMEVWPDAEDPLAPEDDPYCLVEFGTKQKTVPPGIIWRPRGTEGVHTPEAPALTRCFVPATHKDNPMLLKRNPNYLSLLRAQSNRGIRKAMEEGDWDAIEQVEGALWSMADIDESRINPIKYIREVIPHASLMRVVAVDPSSGKNDAFAITVASRDMKTGQIYIEDCFFLEGQTPRKMAEFAVAIYKKKLADYLVVEKNHGGEWMIDTFKQVDKYITVKDVWASKGKLTRAQPVAALFEKDLAAELPFRARIVGTHARLEEELTGHSFNEENPNHSDSPDGLDSLVWACSFLISKVSVARQNKGGYGDGRLRGRR